MSQPNLTVEILVGDDYWASLCDEEEETDLPISSAKTKQTAYKRAAAKLRKLADEAERLAEES